MGTSTATVAAGDAATTGTLDLSALGESLDRTPLVVPVRGHLDSVKRLLRGDVYIGRGSRQRSLPKSRYCNTFKVSQVGRALAISSFRDALRADQVLRNSLWTLSGTRLICHCRVTEDCHGDVLIEEFRQLYPDAYDRNLPRSSPPGREILSFLARLREEPESDDGSSLDEGAPEKFAGHRGIGSPMKVGVGYMEREFCDGQSLASPGRWPPGSRSYPSSPAWISVRDCFWRFTAHYGTEKLLVDLAMGKVEESPFPSAEILQLKHAVIEVAGRAGVPIFRKDGDRVDVPIDYRFLDMLLRASEDPEVGIGEYAQGVKVGPGTRMPRLPALHKPKKKWRLQSQVDPLDYLEYAPDRSGVWRSNYASLREFESQVLEVMHDQASRGQIIVMSEKEARTRYPDLVIASLGAQRKQKPGGKVTTRVLFDGTHGLCVNSKTRLRDQERAPIAADLKRSMREKSKVGELTFALSADVTEAHRQVPIHPDDWHLLGCQVSPGGDINTVGTFGIASASYYWSRVAAAVGRLVQYLSAHTSTSWHMLVADDYLLESGGTEYRTGLLLFFVLCAVVGVPLSWHKTCGGDTLVWVGFELLLRSRCVGISVRRAEWFVRWAEFVAGSPTIHMGTFEEGLGRIMFVAGALEHERPFLAPLHKFLTMHPRDSIRRVPPYVSFILKYLAREVSLKRHSECGTRITSGDTTPRVDAQASDSRTGIGGWFPALDEKGRISTWRSSWFALEITREDFPWVFEKGDRPSLIISTLEALAMVVALKVKFGQEPDPDEMRVLVFPSITDYRGNGAALNKLMSTRFPSSAVLMELASYMRHRGMRAIVEWAPRECNREADMLANGDASLFDPARKLNVSASGLVWNILPEALKAGRDAEENYRLMKETHGLPNRSVKQRKRAAEHRLKFKDPW